MCKFFLWVRPFCDQLCLMKRTALKDSCDEPSTAQKLLQYNSVEAFSTYCGIQKPVLFSCNCATEHLLDLKPLPKRYLVLLTATTGVPANTLAICWNFIMMVVKRNQA